MWLLTADVGVMLCKTLQEFITWKAYQAAALRSRLALQSQNTSPLAEEDTNQKVLFPENSLCDGFKVFMGAAGKPRRIPQVLQVQSGAGRWLCNIMPGFPRGVFAGWFQSGFKCKQLSQPTLKHMVKFASFSELQIT